MNIELITQVLIPIFGAILIYVVVPYIKSKTTAEQRKDAYFLTRLFVQSAEQIFDYKNAGVSKNEYVRKLIRNAMPELTDEDATTMIESAVMEMNKVKEALK